MKNKGQTTVLFSLMIGVLLLFTLTVLEAGRIYLGKVKCRAVIHSTQSSIMADYHRTLFEKYHLLFLDMTYGTGSEAAVEEKMLDYMDCSLNGQLHEGAIYEFSIEEIAVTSQEYILQENMSQLKKQIEQYEKGAGIVQKGKELQEKILHHSVEKAGEETERNATVLPEMKEASNGGEDLRTKQLPDKGEDLRTKQSPDKVVNSGAKQTSDKGGDLGTKQLSDKDGADSTIEYSDPRDILGEKLKGGLLAFLLPEGMEISKEERDFSASPSREYSGEETEWHDSSFQDITKFISFLKTADTSEKQSLQLGQRLYFADYVAAHCSNAIEQHAQSVITCETEYILEGKSSDYENLQEVVSELVWLRLPVNYVYLLGDHAKQSEALTLATTICTATGTLPMVQVVKYLLLGCWSYGESLYEMRLLLDGQKLPYIKHAEDWHTDLATLSGKTADREQTSGMDYNDYLMLLLAKKGGKDICYARLLDIIEKNVQAEDENFLIKHLVGSMTVQGKISINPLFSGLGEKAAYETYFEDTFSY